MEWDFCVSFPPCLAVTLRFFSLWSHYILWKKNNINSEQCKTCITCGNEVDVPLLDLSLALFVSFLSLPLASLLSPRQGHLG